jgi:hypothetical protein
MEYNQAAIATKATRRISSSQPRILQLREGLTFVIGGKVPDDIKKEIRL